VESLSVCANYCPEARIAVYVNMPMNLRVCVIITELDMISRILRYVTKFLMAQFLLLEKIARD
jgi:hypothetical protein